MLPTSFPAFVGLRSKFKDYQSNAVMDGKTFAVVGVAGIAFAVARQLLADCANVALGDLSNLAMATAVVELLDKKERTQELPNSEPDRGVRPQDRIKDCPLGVSNKFQDQMKISSLNVSTRAHVDAWKDAIVRQFGRLDGAVKFGWSNRQTLRYPNVERPG